MLPFNSRQDYNVLFAEKGRHPLQLPDHGLEDPPGVERGRQFQVLIQIT
jgi:hypothetical protein